eukprot:TRINITY_DN4344_c0_g1_i2.p1 TRINITY_DN4344_c0_g1~~TRINITY_DN4344_c0_g1_i2.p1  ORF type:complete len:177 (+),score=26.86 TRINITY_DN4344_c0_g1_i2:348-878(+)
MIQTNYIQILSARRNQFVKIGKTRGPVLVDNDLQNRKPYVGKPSPEHERILIDKSVSIAETARRLDAEGYDGSYWQILSARNSQIASIGRGSRNSNDPSIDELKKRKPYVGKPPPEHERILMDKSVSCAETARRLDAEGYDGSYWQILSARRNQFVKIGKTRGPVLVDNDLQRAKS